MKNYTITVNGNVYDVTVEEGAGGAAAPAAAPRAAAPKALFLLFSNRISKRAKLFT